MLPVVDYGSIAIVVPNISAVGGLIEDDEKDGFEVFLAGVEEPVIIGFHDREEAEESRNELIAIIAQYHYAKEFGPDFDFEELLDAIDDEDPEGKKEH